MLAVFSHRAASRGVAFGSEQGAERFVGDGVTFVFGVDRLAHDFLDLARGDLLALIVEDALGEEVFEGVDAEVGLDILAVADA